VGVIRRSLIIAVIFLGIASAVPAAGGDQDSSSAVTECPGYAEHLRIARAYLERSDRRSALFELKQAREVLRECQAEQEDETALACRSPWRRAG